MPSSLRTRSRVWATLTPVASFFVLYACGKFGSSDQEVPATDSGTTLLDQLAQGDANTFVPPDAATCVFKGYANSGGSSGTSGVPSTSGTSGSTGTSGGSTGTSGGSTTSGSTGTSGGSTTSGSTGTSGGSTGTSGGSTSSSGGSTSSSGGSSGTAASSSGVSGAALCGQTYDCLGTPVTVSCNCQTQRCSCNGTEVSGLFVCAGGPQGACVISSVHRQGCGLPAADPPF